MTITPLYDYVEDEFYMDFEAGTHRILDDDRIPIMIIDINPAPEFDEDYDKVVEYAEGLGGTIIQEWNIDTWRWEDIIS